MKALLFLFLFFIGLQANAACFANLTTSNTIVSKIRGFYINRDHNGDTQSHSVILDKATCTASPSGDVVLAPVTKSHYYLSFSSSDETLYASLLSAHAQEMTVEFRMTGAREDPNVNAIAYIIAPAGARSQ